MITSRGSNVLSDYLFLSVVLIVFFLAITLIVVGIIIKLIAMFMMQLQFSNVLNIFSVIFSYLGIFILLTSSLVFVSALMFPSVRDCWGYFASKWRMWTKKEEEEKKPLAATVDEIPNYQ